MPLNPNRSVEENISDSLDHARDLMAIDRTLPVGEGKYEKIFGMSKIQAQFLFPEASPRQIEILAGLRTTLYYCASTFKGGMINPPENENWYEETTATQRKQFDLYRDLILTGTFLANITPLQRVILDREYLGVTGQ